MTLLERQAELGKLDGMLRAAEAGSGRVLVIEGAPGIGKTALLTEASERASAEGFAVTRATGGPDERDLPLAAARQLVEPLLRGMPTLEAADVLGGAAAPAAAAMGLSPSADGQITETAAVLHGIYWTIANLAERTPLLLAADDVQWFDPLSVRALNYILRRVRDLPVAMVIATRPPEPGSAGELVSGLLTDGAAEVAHLAPLSAAAMTALTQTYFDGNAEAAFCEACADAAGGNPFLVLSLLRALVDAGVRPTAAAADNVLAVGAEGVGRSIRKRLRSLPPSANAIAEAVVVLGTDADPYLVGELAALDSDSVAHATGVLARAELMIDERPYRMSHPLVAAAIRSGITRSRLAQMHGRAAQLLMDTGADLTRAAHHLFGSDPAGDERAAAVLEAAGTSAASRGAPDTAASYFARALAEPAPGHRRVDLLIELGMSESRAGSRTALDHLRRAYDLCGDESKRLEIALMLRTALARFGSGAEAIETLKSLMPQFAEDSRQRLAVTIASAGFLTTSGAGLAAPYLADLQQQLDDGTALPDYALAVLSMAQIFANRPSGPTVEMALQTLGRHEGEAPEWWSSFIAVAMVCSDHPQALPTIEASLQAAGQQGDLFWRGLDLENRGWLRLRQGDVRSAEIDVRLAIESFDLANTANRVPEPVGHLCDVLSLRGEIGEAEKLLAERGYSGALDPEPADFMFLEAARGRLRAAQGNYEQAVVDLRAAGERCTALGIVTSAYEGWRPDLADALARTGRLSEAAAVAEEDLALAREFGTARVIGAALTGLAAARPDDSLELLEEAVDTLSPSPAKIELVKAQIALGVARRRRRDQAGASDILRKAMDIASAVGASRLAELARAELVAAGGRPRRQRLTGLSALTPSELRVATHAAEGYTNREIAQAMFLSIKTVETHLAQAYRKLGIARRPELQDALEGSAAV